MEQSTDTQDRDRRQDFWAPGTVALENCKK